jgi:glycosyltransferase involved in cell wall biosynthesis
VLAALVCALKPLLRFRVVVDRHSNFTFADTDTGFRNRLSNYSLRRADLTIVTNDFVKRLVESKGGRAFVLQDKLPTLAAAARPRLEGRFNAVFVCTFSPDEPLEAVVEAARLLDSGVRVYVTGRRELLPEAVRARAPRQVVFTGFLPDAQYASLLATADVVLELTTRDHTLLCGAYEAVSLGTPLVVSRTDALMSYFHKGAVVTGNTPLQIARAIREAERRQTRLRQEVGELREELTRDWNERFAELARLIAAL